MSNDRILVVDDNPANLKLASDLLEWAGYQVFRAVDAEEASAVIRETPPRLILLDIGLPGMDGLALTRQLKAADATRDILVIALTAFAMKGDQQKTEEAGCNGYISKPIDTRSFPDQVAAYLNRQKAS